MWEYTAKEVAAAVLGSIGGIGGLITLINVITARLDKRRERQTAEKLLDVSNSVDLRRVRLEEEKVDEGIWEGVAKDKQAEIAGLKDELQKERIAHSTTKQAAKQTLDNLYTMFSRLRVAKIPDEVVDIIAEKIEMAKTEIRKGRDALS